MVLSIYCDFCDQPVYLTEDGYCSQCGKHSDNMNPEDYYEQGSQSVEIDEFTQELLDFSKKDLKTGEKTTLMYIDDHTVIGDHNNHDALMHLIKERNNKT